MHSILVVEDMAIFREPIEASLRAAGIAVRTATNGVEALLAIAEVRPDLILLDLVMPVMDGLTTLRAIRSAADTKDIPVIVLSGENERDRVLQARALGISGYVLKTTFSLQTLFARIQAALQDSAPTGSQIDSHHPPLSTGHPSGGDAPITIAGGSGALPTAGAVETPAGLPSATKRMELKALRPLIQRSELLKRLNASEEVQGFSPTVTHILKLTGARQCSMEEVARAVGQDHAMSLKVLRLANSPVYSRGDCVDTVQKAVLRIGMTSIRQAVMNIAVVDRYSGAHSPDDMSGPLLWEHSIACGIIASELAHALRLDFADTAFTAGLLHDLGRLVFAERLGDDYRRVLHAAEQLQLPLEEVEARLLTLNHADAMDHVLRAWRFPKDLVAPVVLHHSTPAQIRSAAPGHVQDVLCISLANRLAHALMLGSSGNEAIYPTEELCRILKVRPETILLIEQTAQQRTEDTKFALLASSHNAAWPRRSDAHRAALAVPFRPLFVSSTPECDAFRILCDQLAETPSSLPPNLAVVHVASTKDCAQLADQLSAAEGAAGVGRLPVLVVCPDGAATMVDRLVRGRLHACVTTPVVAARFVESAGTLLAAAGAKRAA